MVEIIPRPPEEIPLWQNILFCFSIAFLIGAIFSYFLLNYLQGKAQLKLDKLEEAIAQVRTAEEIKLEKEVLAIKKKIDDFWPLFAKHLMASKFFKVLEGLCHPRVQFTTLELNLADFSAKISGRADNFQIVDQQLRIFKKAREKIKDLNLSDLTFGEKGIAQFTFTLFFDPEILK